MLDFGGVLTYVFFFGHPPAIEISGSGNLDPSTSDTLSPKANMSSFSQKLKYIYILLLGKT